MIIRHSNRYKVSLIKIILISLLFFTFNSNLSFSNIQKQANDILEECAIKGGLIVHIGCDDGKLTAALRQHDGFLVHGLDQSEQNVKAAREYIRSLKQYGKISIACLRGDVLPYGDNLVNLLVAEERGGLSTKELMRVLAPNGMAYIKEGDAWTKLHKPRPEEMDEWTHYLHDASGNPVAKDSLIGPPRRLQWVGSPRWSRHHDHMSSMSALVSSGRRIFYIMDEGSSASILLPSEWMLIARDAFNGTVLWKKPIEQWHTQLWPLKSGPAQLPRRLVAQDDTVFVTLGIDAPVSALDAATGEVIRCYKETRSTEEMILSNGILYLLVNPNPQKETYSKLQQIRRGYNDKFWDEKPRKIMAIQAESGDVLWTYNSCVLPNTLASKGQSVYFHNGEKIVCLNTQNGDETWISKPISRSEEIKSFFSPTLVVYKDVVLFAGGERAGKQRGEWYTSGIDTMAALSTEKGEILWQANHPPSGYRSPEDILVLNDLVWTGETTSGNVLGFFRGRDLHTGNVRREFIPDVDTYWFHHRCYRAKATENYLLTSRTGIEFVDPETKHWQIHHWVRGACLYGIMPANGLVYAPPHPCACYLEAKLNGFNALAPALADGDVPEKLSNSERLEKGPAYDAIHEPSSENLSGDWPTYRHNSQRSGSTKTSLSANLKQAWKTEIDGQLTSVVVAEGKVFVASVEEHTLYALDEASGKIAWHYTTGGRIDSPPTIYKGRVLFGSADGWVYCLRASDGALAWRFLAAPMDRRLVAFEQVESVWPVHGNVLIQDDTLYCVAGRSMFIDGGMTLWRLDPETGSVLSETVLDDRTPIEGKDLQSYVSWLNMPTAMPDILSSDGRLVYMRSQPFNLDGTRLPLKKFAKSEDLDRGAPPATQNPEHAHLFSPTGFTDDSYWHRTYWLYGSKFVSGWCGYYLAGKTAPAGKILAFDDSNVYGFGRKPQYYRWTTPLEYQLFATNKNPNLVKTTDRKGNPTNNEHIEYQWNKTIPLLVRSMVLANNTLFIAGPSDVVDEAAILNQLNTKETQTNLKAQDKALKGQKGSTLHAISTKDGTQLKEYNLDSTPVWDGMAIAGDGLFMATVGGEVLCWREG